MAEDSLHTLEVPPPDPASPRRVFLEVSLKEGLYPMMPHSMYCLPLWPGITLVLITKVCEYTLFLPASLPQPLTYRGQQGAHLWHAWQRLTRYNFMQYLKTSLLSCWTTGAFISIRFPPVPLPCLCISIWRPSPNWRSVWVKVRKVPLLQEVSRTYMTSGTSWINLLKCWGPERYRYLFLHGCVYRACAPHEKCVSVPICSVKNCYLNSYLFPRLLKYISVTNNIKTWLWGHFCMFSPVDTVTKYLDGVQEPSFCQRRIHQRVSLLPPSAGNKPHGEAIWAPNYYANGFLSDSSHGVSIWRPSCVKYTSSVSSLTLDQQTFLSVSPRVCRNEPRPWWGVYQSAGRLFTLLL